MAAAAGKLVTFTVDVEGTVDGCPDDTARAEWTEHCTGQADGVPRPRGAGGGAGKALHVHPRTPLSHP